MSTWVIIAAGEDSITHRPTLVLTSSTLPSSPFISILDQKMKNGRKCSVPVKTCTGNLYRYMGGKGGRRGFLGEHVQALRAFLAVLCFSWQSLIRFMLLGFSWQSLYSCYRWPVCRSTQIRACRGGGCIRLLPSSASSMDTWWMHCTASSSSGLVDLRSGRPSTPR